MKRCSIIINRAAIRIPRSSICLTTSQRMMDKVQKKREELGIATYTEQQILKIAEYYNYKCRQVVGVAGWRCLGKNFRKHRNWKLLTRIYALCEENHWDYKVYLDSQFYRVRNWKRNVKYPYLTHCVSQAAVYAYHSYIKEFQSKYSVTGTAKVKSEIPKTCRDEIIDLVIKDCDRFVKLKTTKQRKYRGLTPQQIKFMYIVDNISAFSKYYWASLPWAVSYLQRFNSQWVKDLVEVVQKLQKSKSMMRLINKVVSEVELQMGIAPTVIPEMGV